MTNPAPVTVVIATLNRRDELFRTLQQVSTLPERPALIVVDNHSADGTPEAVRRAFPEVTLIPLPANLGAAARNIGVQLAATPYIAFNDDDSWWQPGALAVAVKMLEHDPHLGLIAGHILVGADKAPDPTCLMMATGELDEWLRPSPHGARGVTGFLACAAVVRRSAFLAAGGFNAALLIGGEEELITLDLADAGWKLVYAANVAAEHHPSRHRDTPTRQRLLLRNHLVTAWLRLSARRALRRSAMAIMPTMHRPGTWAALYAVAIRTPWMLSQRHRIRAEVQLAFDHDRSVRRC